MKKTFILFSAFATIMAGITAFVAYNRNSNDLFEENVETLADQESALGTKWYVRVVEEKGEVFCTPWGNEDC